VKFIYFWISYDNPCSPLPAFFFPALGSHTSFIHHQLVEVGLKQLEIEEIASQIGQLYYNYYLRMSGLDQGLLQK
jgi:hypothetical protein